MDDIAPSLDVQIAVAAAAAIALYAMVFLKARRRPPEGGRPTDGAERGRSR